MARRRIVCGSLSPAALAVGACVAVGALDLGLADALLETEPLGEELFFCLALADLRIFFDPVANLLVNQRTPNEISAVSWLSAALRGFPDLPPIVGDFAAHAGCGDEDVDVFAAQRAFPSVGRPVAGIAENCGAFGHALAKSERHAVQILLREM